jgi:hypothetical protein
MQTKLMTKKSVALVVLLGIASLITLALNHSGQARAVDACLDSGGSFDYVRSVCDYQVNHLPKAENS